MDVAAKVPTLAQYLASATAAGGTQVVQAVIYDLPDRDCAAESSAGEFSIADNGTALYKQYIDNIAAAVEGTPECRHFLKISDSFDSANPTVRTVFVVEPDGLANLVTNSNIEKCANAASTYKVMHYSVQFALTTITLSSGTRLLCHQ